MSAGWWAAASKEQRLAQCRGGAEAGLSASDLAIMLGASHSAIRSFCLNAGIPLTDETHVWTRRRKRAAERHRESENNQRRHHVAPAVDEFIEKNL